MSEWISVFDKLPDSGVRVLIQPEDGNMVCSKYWENMDGGGNWEDDDGSCFDTYTVAYWMYLPEPPNK